MINIDKLIGRIDELGNPSVVGLDPSLSMMPAALADEMYDAHGRTPQAVAEMFSLYNEAIIDAVCDIVPAVKPQVAMYEMYGADGILAYVRTCGYAAMKGLYVIGDVKRGDISSTAEAYAAHLGGVEIGPVGGAAADGFAEAPELGDEAIRYDLWNEDAVTVNPYLGTDGIKPFADACRLAGKSIFVLVKTSNKSSAELQDLIVRGGVVGDNCDDVEAPLYEHVGRLVERWGSGLVGSYGYSAVGAVVGATHPRVGARLRQLMPHTFFLVPGYGAQGATAAELKGFFDANGRGCIVNSSRGIIAAWQKGRPADEGPISRKPETMTAATAHTPANAAHTSANAAPARTHSEDTRQSLNAVASAARAAALAMRDDIRENIGCPTA
ncbi:MAG: orotidine-5'-phosphate decarboxylase [Clostridiales Family XIII bacterium]|jgi:orotidine-5'-phosphate decarboxylase|nr:orotidine-5'-phosphate decarboxylase [Clostridiales Family XIII bacterium]